MGQRQSRFRRAKDASILELQEEIAKTRRELKNTKKIGKMLRKSFAEEIRDQEKEQAESKLHLKNLGDRCVSFLRFWVYLRAIKRSSSVPSEEEDQVPSKSTVASERSRHRAIVKRSMNSSFSIIQLVEANLLRKIHKAMIVKSQKETLSKTWNGVIMFMYHSKIDSGDTQRIAQVQKDLRVINAENELLIISRKKNTLRLLRLQEGLIEKLQQAEVEAERRLLKGGIDKSENIDNSPPDLNLVSDNSSSQEGNDDFGYAISPHLSVTRETPEDINHKLSIPVIAYTSSMTMTENRDDM